MNEQLVISAIESLRSEMRQGFLDAAEDHRGLKADLTKVTDDHEARLRDAEETLTTYRTYGSILGALVGAVSFEAAVRYWAKLVGH